MVRERGLMYCERYDAKERGAAEGLEANEIENVKD